MRQGHKTAVVTLCFTEKYSRECSFHLKLSNSKERIESNSEELTSNE